jgi:hypothetical protein
VAQLRLAPGRLAARVELFQQDRQRVAGREAEAFDQLAGDVVRLVVSARATDSGLTLPHVAAGALEDVRSVGPGQGRRQGGRFGLFAQQAQQPAGAGGRLDLAGPVADAPFIGAAANVPRRRGDGLAAAGQHAQRLLAGHGERFDG